jgi:Asp-tRNA(Asn)/Glu-tRNA(Gln) amidotransferase A subunit family amidase
MRGVGRTIDLSGGRASSKTGAPMTQDLAQLSAADLSVLYRAKAASPVEATEAILARIKLLQPHFNSYRAIEVQSALAQARASEARWARGAPQSRLDGVPVGFKDLANVQDFPIRKGSLATPDKVETEDSPPAARLREGGAIILDKTQTAEFGLKGLTETKLGGITPNAWDRQYASGGSSGGAAVSAALGLGPLQIGTDGGGSIRSPASVNGVFGFKPIFGRVAGYPHNGSLFHIGPITGTVTDAALLLNVIAASDVRDWSSLPKDGGIGPLISTPESMGCALATAVTWEISLSILESSPSSTAPSRAWPSWTPSSTRSTQASATPRRSSIRSTPSAPSGCARRLASRDYTTSQQTSS